ncbi:SDR family NAD(P)-dependent oxidoreductase [Actinacidiphila oryziradicis]|uniref:SDR family oxidoreductase n=1 Tax=Actinacidiphila oryziradicis TaxID=2571141 RepID=A0A4U0SGG8_9ACTN|nr:SDR family NAD(P)-dependent oxidoreductase [Actinacidiphila oryziradicis]TKA08576.1 SDR family oxidoreductase [Actinacidiphila oryziradicis]
MDESADQTLSGWRLQGRRVLVTGGSRGLGEAIVKRLVAEGCTLAVCARGVGQLQQLAERIEQRGRTPVFTRALDVAAPELLEDFVGDAAARLGGLDGVVACAGGASGRGLEGASAQDWMRTWELNAGHAARLLAASAPHLRAAGGGSAVIVASISGWKPGPQAQYGAAKAAQIHLAASLARELGADDIRVNAVSPGSMLIPGKRWDRMRQEDPGAYAAFTREVPSGELVRPEEVAAVVTFLLSDQASGISGANIPVDRAQNSPTPQGY